MSGIDDLNAAVTAVVGAVQSEISEVEAVIAALQSGGLTDSQAEALAQQLQGSVTNLNNETTKLQGLVPPPAQSTPTPQP